MLGETAVSLAKEADSLPHNYGILTPATALGSVLIEKLQSKALQFSVE